jgi:hypothetical protein
MRTVWTKNSTYEIDEVNKLVRRVHGLNDPTPRQGADGEWKEYVGIIIAPRGMLIQWGTNPDGSLKCTWTSKVIKIDNSKGFTTNGLCL